MKKLSLLLVSAMLGLISLTPAFACRGGWGPGGGPGGYGYGPGYCEGPYSRGDDRDEQIDQARKKFLDQSKELRKQLYDKKTTYYDLLAQEKPNKEEAAKLWNEIFDLQTQLQQMAADAGFTPRRWRNGGYGYDEDNMPGCGYGRDCYGPGGRW
jgi:Spy/CpxP family protein refolding chaperone